MTAWILDDGPFGHLAKIIGNGNLQNWPTGQLFVAEQTAVDAEHDQARKALLTANPTPFRTFRIMMGTEAFEIVFGHLRRLQSRTTANSAEHQSIAWIITEQKDGVLVTEDKKAAFLALAELGKGHVAHSYDLWLYLRDKRLVNQTQFDNLCEATRKVIQGEIPWRFK